MCWNLLEERWLWAAGRLLEVVDLLALNLLLSERMPLRSRCTCGEPADGCFYPAGEPFVDWCDLETTREAVECGACGRVWWLLTNTESRQVRLEMRRPVEACELESV